MDIGAYEARTHFSHLLDDVAAGHRFTITKHGVPVAVLAPPGQGLHLGSRQDTLAALREFRRGITLGELELGALIAEGRR
ncbi:MAG: type II toxin-antitoxin system Phd/YefM family antitoxin [Candidatus Dormibacteria bacterium]